MDLNHRFSVPAGPNETWNALNDLEALAPCFPGATLTEINGDTFTGSVKIKFGPLALVYDGGGRYRERDAGDRRVVLETSGTDRRGNGELRATIAAHLVEPRSDPASTLTVVEVRTDLQVTGRPATFGDEVISDISTRLAEQFVACLQPRFAEGLGSTPPSALDPSRSTESEEGHAAGDRVELGASPEEIDGLSSPASVASAAPRRAAPPDTPPRYTPPSNTAQPDINVLATVAQRVVKRYWPVLAGVAALTFVASKILGRRR